MSSYEGGAHPAELIATDAAGNTRKRSWTIKVSPDGVVPPSEAEATVDALEETSSINLLDPTKEEANLEGTAPDLGIHEASGGLVTTGGANRTEVATSAGAGMVVNVAPPEALEGYCALDGDLEPADGLTGAEEEELAEDPPGNCTPNPAAPDGTDPLLTPVDVAPTAVSPEASQTVLTEGEVSTIATNVSPNVDLITRPLFDGAMTFAAIRDAAAADSFSWRVELDQDQELKLIDNRNIAVHYENGPVAFSIAAVPAHDAVGTTVPTALSISGDDVITLSVAHRGGSPDGKPFVYPVVGGAGWEGGFQTYAVVMPPPEQEQEEAEEGAYSEGEAVLLFAQGAPIHNANDSATVGLSAGSASKKKKFKFVYCMPHEFPGGQGVAHDYGETIPWVEKKNLPMIVSECNNPELEGIYWKTSVHGWFHYIRGEWVWIKPYEFKCEKGGEEKNKFAEVDCRAYFAVGETRIAGTGLASKAPIKMMGNWRFRGGAGQWANGGVPTCFTMGGLLDKTPNRIVGRPVQRPLIREKEGVNFTQACDWPEY